MNGRSILIDAAAVVVGFFIAVGGWYYFAVSIPLQNQQRLIDEASSVPASTAPAVVTSTPQAVASSTATSTFFGSVVKIANTTSDPPALFLYPGPFLSFSSNTVSIVGIVQSSPSPLTNVIVDPRYAAGLSGDAYMKIDVLEPVLPSTPQESGAATFFGRLLDGKPMDIIASNVYMSGFGLVPGDLVMMQVSGCALYDGWPITTCTNAITLPQQWTVAPNDLFVSWQGQNGAALSLAGVSLNTFASNSVLAFQVNATSGYGEFCPASLLQSGPTMTVNESGAGLYPTLALPSACIGPNATSTASAFLPFPTTTSTVLTIDVSGQGGVSPQTFFELYPLSGGNLFLLNASTSEAGGQ
jgi:hypothetical protein